MRLLGVDSEPVNHGWLCDKGRYGIEWVHSDARILDPMVRQSGELAEVSWPEALDAAASEIKRVRDLHGPGAIAVLGGARGTNEDAYAWARLAKGVIGTDNVDAQLGDGLPAEVVLGLPRAEIADVDTAAAIVLLGPDLQEELPVLFLRIKRAAKELGVPLVDLAPLDHALTPFATAVGRLAPGAGVGAAELEQIAQARGDRPGPVVVVFGRTSLAESPPSPSGRPARSRTSPTSASCPRCDAGTCTARSAPGSRRACSRAASRSTPARSGSPSTGARRRPTRGLDAAGILGAAADGKIQVLVLLGADPLSDFPDADLAQRGVDGAGFVIAVDGFVSDSTRRADVFLPCTLWGEKTGTITNLEDRVQRVGRKVAPEGTAMDDWRIAVELAYRLGRDFDLATVDEVADEVARVAPAQLGANAALLRRARDGVVLPFREHVDEIVLRTRELSILSEDGQGTSWDPIKVEGEAAADVGEDQDPPVVDPEPEVGGRGARAARMGPRRRRP